MKKFLLISLSLLASVTYAQDHAQMHMQHHHASTGPDTRILVPYTPEMRQANLASMRDHLTVISELLTHLSALNFEKAAQIAENRLGLGSPSAESCEPSASNDSKESNKPKSQNATPATMALEDEMAKIMPKEMQEIGLNMHQAATEFAKEAKRSVKSQHLKRPVAALAKVTQYCVTCHATYKTQ